MSSSGLRAERSGVEFLMESASSRTFLDPQTNGCNTNLSGEGPVYLLGLQELAYLFVPSFFPAQWVERTEKEILKAMETI